MACPIEVVGVVGGVGAGVVGGVVTVVSGGGGGAVVAGTVVDVAVGEFTVGTVVTGTGDVTVVSNTS